MKIDINTDTTYICSDNPSHEFKYETGDYLSMYCKMVCINCGITFHYIGERDFQNPKEFKAGFTIATCQEYLVDNIV